MKDEFTRALDQVTLDSDRSAGVVGGSFVEDALTTAVQSCLAETSGIDVIKDLFRASGPLGTFSTKIQLGFLLGLYSEEVYRDLITIKRIRNKFAHDLIIDKFSDEGISSLCFNLRIVETHCLVQDEIDELTAANLLPEFWVYTKDKEAKASMLAGARDRFFSAVLVLNGLLSQAGLTRGVRRPVIPSGLRRDIPVWGPLITEMERKLG